MAPPFDLNWTPALENKISTQIDGQLPDFIAEDHPKFSQFLKSYYQFLEAGELQLTVNIDNILLELNLDVLEKIPLRHLLLLLVSLKELHLFLLYLAL